MSESDEFLMLSCLDFRGLRVSPDWVSPRSVIRLTVNNQKDTSQGRQETSLLNTKVFMSESQLKYSDSPEFALDILSGWNWEESECYDVDNSVWIMSNELLADLTLAGHTNSSLAILTLLAEGKMQALANYSWSRNKRGEKITVVKVRDLVHEARFVAMQKAMTACKPPNLKANLATIPEKPEGYITAGSKWSPDVNRMYYAMRPAELNTTEESDGEEVFTAEEMMFSVRSEDVACWRANLERAESAKEASTAVINKPQRRYPWERALVATFGRIYRGEFKPAKQAEIEDAISDFLNDGVKVPSESGVREYAQILWDEISKV